MLNLNIYKDLLTKEECRSIIEYSTPLLRPSGLLGDSSIPYFRTSKDTFGNDNLPLFLEIKKRIRSHFGIPIENMENISVIKYGVGEEFKPHNDFFHKGEPYYEEEMRKGGQRLTTFLISLQRAEEGGETFFPLINQKFTIEEGHVAMWSNVTNFGTPIRDSLHAGLPVIKGEKWVATVWCRERAFKA